MSRLGFSVLLKYLCSFPLRKWPNCAIKIFMNKPGFSHVKHISPLHSPRVNVVLGYDDRGNHTRGSQVEDSSSFGVESMQWEDGGLFEWTRASPWCTVPELHYDGYTGQGTVGAVYRAVTAE